MRNYGILVFGYQSHVGNQLFFSPAPRTPFRYEACWAASLKLGAGAKKHPKRVSLVLLFCYSKQHSSTAHVRATSTKKHRSTKDCECQSSWQRQICLAYVSIRPWKKNIHLYIWGVSINGGYRNGWFIIYNGHSYYNG
jgi:hypothetical protein